MPAPKFTYWPKIRLSDSAKMPARLIGSFLHFARGRFAPRPRGTGAERAPETFAPEQRAQQLEALNSVIAATSSVLEMPALIRSTLDQMLQILEVPRGMIWVQDHVTARGIDETTVRRLAGAIRQANRRTAVTDWDEAPAEGAQELASAVKDSGIRASITLPIFCGGKIDGHIFLAGPQPRAWMPEESALLEIIAHQIGFTAERVQFINDIQTQNQMMKTLVARSEMLNRPFTPRGVIEAIGSGAQELSSADALAILVQERDQTVRCPWSFQLPAELVARMLAELEGRSALFFSPNPLLIDDLRQAPGGHAIFEHLRQAGLRAAYAWPLVYGSQASVFVCCFYRRARSLKANAQEVMEAFVRQAAAAMENTRLFEAETAQRQLAEALREVTAQLASTLDLDEVLNGILEQLRRVIPHDASNIMVIENGEAGVLGFQGYPLEHHETLRNLRLPVDGLHSLRKMVETRQAVVIPDVQADPLWTDLPFSRWIRSYAGVPMIHRGEVLGFINLNSGQPNFFRLEVGSILQTFANQAAVFIENARLYQKTQQRAAETETLFRAMLPLFNTNKDVVALARQIAQSVTQEFASAHCSVLLINEARTHLVLVAQSGQIQPSLPELALDGPGLTVAAVKSKKMIYAPDVSKEPLYVNAASETRSELVIPLFGRDDILGVLNMESHAPDAFDQHAHQVISSYAERAALGLENARLFETIRRYADQMIQLTTVTRIALQSLDSQLLLDQLVRLVAGMIKADGCYITLWDEKTGASALLAGYGPDHHQYPGIAPLPGELTLTESAVKANRTLVIEDICGSPYLNPRLAPGFPLQSVMALPLVTDDYRLGAMLVGFARGHVFTNEEIALCEQASGQIALALTRLRLLELAQRRAHEAETLRQVGLALTSSLELPQVLESILTHIEQVIPYDSACVFLVDGSSLVVGQEKNIDHRQAGSIFEQRWASDDELFMEVKRTLRPVILPDAQADPRFKRWGATGYVRGWMGVPLLAGSTILGLLTLDRREAHSFTTDEVDLALGFATHAALAIQNARLHSDVQHLAITDPLTGAYNRRGFFELARKIMAAVLRSRRPLSALMIDIDFFKRINDRYGHDVGDAVLHEMMERCKKILRESDIVCRYGGEEFAVLLPESDLHGAFAAASRLHASIAQKPITSPAGPVEITVSIGVATLTEACATLEGLLKCADVALYHAKQAGRNCVSVWDDQMAMQP